jgi:hypothetical protein
MTYFVLSRRQDGTPVACLQSVTHQDLIRYEVTSFQGPRAESDLLLRQRQRGLLLTEEGTAHA